MATKKPSTKSTTVTKKDTASVIINQLIIRSANRGRSDISKWRAAHISAEQVLGTGSRVQLYDLYSDAIVDAHLSAIIDKRIMSITNHKLRFIQGDKDVPELEKIIKTKGFRKLLTEIIMAKLWGITVAELQYNNKQLECYSVPRKHIRPRTQTIVTEQFGNGENGTSYRDGFLLNSVVEIGETEDLGLLLKAVPFILYKRGCWGDWAQFCEVFGMPTKIGRYDGYDTNTKVELERALDEAGSALSLVIPKEASIEFLEAKTSQGSSDIYKTLANACDEQLSILILGQTETTKSSASSGYAQSKEHSKQQTQIAEDDRAYVLAYLETEIRRVFTAMGLPMEGGEWQWVAEEENLSIKDKCDIDLQLKASGLPIDDDYFYDKYSIPKPANYEKLKKEATPEAPKKEPEEKEPEEKLTLADLRDFFDFATPKK